MYRNNFLTDYEYLDSIKPEIMDYLDSYLEKFSYKYELNIYYPSIETIDNIYVIRMGFTSLNSNYHSTNIIKNMKEFYILEKILPIYYETLDDDNVIVDIYEDKLLKMIHNNKRKQKLIKINNE